MKAVRLFLFAALVSTHSPVSQAVEIPWTTKCVSASFARVHDSITNYTHYTSLPGAQYSEEKFGKTISLEMEKVQTTFSRKDSTGTTAVVVPYLRVAHLKEDNLRPRFALNCTSDLQSDGFKHHCTLDDDVDHFAVKNLITHLTVKALDPRCTDKTAPTALSYQIEKLDGDTVDIAKIKSAVISELFLGLQLPEFALEHLFDVDGFFKSYYQHFYDGWISTLH